MNMLQQIRYYQNLTNEEFTKLIQNKQDLLAMSSNIFNVLFLNINNNYKKVLLDDLELFNKIMSLPLNIKKKSIIDLSDHEIKEYIYNHPHLLQSPPAQKLVKDHLEKLNIDELTILLNNPNLNEAITVDINEKIKEYNITDTNVTTWLVNSINSKQFKSLALLKIKNQYELLIYSKFNILVEVKDLVDGYLIIKDKKIKYDFVVNVNRKHIISLIALASEKENNLSNNVLFISILKLYMTFGLDNSKKVLADNFTFSTNSSLKRASLELIKDIRRDFRLKNQDKFYYHRMEEDFDEALRNRDLEYFKNFCSKEDKYVQQFLKEVERTLENITSLEERLEKIKEIIHKEITKREKYYQNQDINKYKKYYQTTARTTVLSILDIYDLLGDIDLKYLLSRDGKLIPNKELLTFLLGNFKKDNDCLLRMVLNKQALGLNTELYNILNNFNQIQEYIIQDNEMSLNSILDVIDISKVFLYNLKPNELDISLDVLSKILNSRKYCTEEPEEILKRVMELHQARKRRISCAVPLIKGETAGTKYEIPNFNDPKLLISGIESNSCLKVGGKGEDFLRFCLTNPKGFILYIEYNNIEYIIPCTINGNMLNINSIDPRLNDESTYNHLMSSIIAITKELVSNPNTNLEIVTITDIHHEEFMKKRKDESIKFQKFLPLNTDVYCDYNKPDVTNYILYKKNQNSEPKYFNNQSVFYQKRLAPYIFSPTRELDSERIEIFINDIAYSSIDHLNITDIEKERQKYCYNIIKPKDFLYIVGNIDWFIGITNKNQVIKCCLPYDKRGIEEYQKYLHHIQNILISKDEDFLAQIKLKQH